MKVQKDVGDTCKSVVVILVAARTQSLTSQSKAHFFINIFHPGTFRQLQPWTMLLQPSSPANIPGSSFVDALLSLPHVCQGPKKNQSSGEPQLQQEVAPPGGGVGALFRDHKGADFPNCVGIIFSCSRFLKSGASETNERWRCFVLFLKKPNNEIALQTVKARDAAVMRISSSGGAQPAAIQMNGAADNSANSSRAIILHASGPRGLFFIPHQAMLTHNFLLSLSAAISCSDHLLATAGLIRQTVGRSADVTLGAQLSHFGPGRRRVAASPSGHRLQNSGNHTLLFLLLLPLTSARNLSIRATVT